METVWEIVKRIMWGLVGLGFMLVAALAIGGIASVPIGWGKLDRLVLVVLGFAFVGFVAIAVADWWGLRHGVPRSLCPYCRVRLRWRLKGFLQQTMWAVLGVSGFLLLAGRLYPIYRTYGLGLTGWLLWMALALLMTAVLVLFVWVFGRVVGLDAGPEPRVDARLRQEIDAWMESRKAEWQNL